MKNGSIMSKTEDTLRNLSYIAANSNLEKINSEPVKEIVKSLWTKGKWKSLSRVQLCDPMDYTVPEILQASIQVANVSLLQGIFPTQG